jgi:hypothetical protein
LLTNFISIEDAKIDGTNLYFGRREAMQHISKIDMKGLGLIINADGDKTISNVLPPQYVCGMSVVQYVKVMLKDASGSGSTGFLSLVLGELVPIVDKHLDSKDSWVLIVCKHGRNRYRCLIAGFFLQALFVIAP